MGEVFEFPTPDRGWWSARPWFTTEEVGHVPWKRIDRCTKSLERIALWKGMPHVVKCDATSYDAFNRFSAALEELIRIEFPMQKWTTLLYDRRIPVALFRCQKDADTFACYLRVNFASGDHSTRA